MAIEVEDLRTIFRALTRVKNFSRGKLLILGNATVHCSSEQIRRIAEEEQFALASTDIPPSLSPKSLGMALGFRSAETLDLAAGGDIQLDLSANNLPQNLLAQYDVVIDAGVLFWCFDPASAIKNIYRLISADGMVVHITALTGHISRGYFNIHPRFFEDFYDANQCTFLLAAYRSNFGRSGWTYWLKKILRLQNRSRFYTEKGYIFPNKICFHYAEFGTHPVVNLPFLPIDMVSVACFQKCANQAVQSPALTSI